MADGLTRACGVLLHPTSLPGPHGIGDLGASADHFLDFLVESRQSYWQVLPLNPVGFGNSPYASPSAFAGNPLLISLDRLADEGLLTLEESRPWQPSRANRVDYERASMHKQELLLRAYERFLGGSGDSLRPGFLDFAARHASWLEDYALFAALKDAHGGKAWTDWDPLLAACQVEAIAEAKRRWAAQIDYHRFVQFLFFSQWSKLRLRANDRGIRLIGDLPIFVAHDSVDVWAHRYLFSLDQAGRPTVVAGVPPDYFSPTGQRWGNPLYRWERLAATGYAWWIARFRALMEVVDAVRIDHFRGFESYWEVPAEHATAEHGRWVPGPGAALFRAVRDAIGDFPIIVEDLGLITPAVESLRAELGHPGMKVLQFAFGSDPDNPYLPHNYERRCVVYTATHDNDTSVGWYDSLPAHEQMLVDRYAGRSDLGIAWDLIRLAFTSVADLAMIPLQDVLSLDSSARMNFPGEVAGNWAWRLADEPNKEVAERLAGLTVLTRRAIRYP